MCSEWLLVEQSYIIGVADTRVVEIATDQLAVGARSLGRPRKNWSDNLLKRHLPNKKTSRIACINEREEEDCS